LALGLPTRQCDNTISYLFTVPTFDLNLDLTLTLHGQPVTLLASCLGDGDTGGGLLYYAGQSWIVIDDVSTTGLFVAGDQLIRILWAPSQAAESTSILHYTIAGFAREVIVGGLTDPHDVLWDGRHYIAVSSFQDSVVSVNIDGTIIKRFQPAQGSDCWHLNSLLMHNGILYAAAFGRFDEPRGWVGHHHEGRGMIFRIDTGEDVLTGLCCPHTPRIYANQWIVCNSASSELRTYSFSGELVRTVQLQDWVRGVAIADEYVFVGESVNRQLTNDVRGATVAVIDRKTLSVLGHLRLPFREVYDLVLVSPQLLSGVRQSPNARFIASCPPEIPLRSPDQTAI
jgi:uncharacterized protein (TIGR03032 family)